MQAPDDCPRPPEGKLLAWCRNGYMGGSWLVVDHTGKIVTNRFCFDAAHIVNKHNNNPG